jgi:hypothetical protein
MKLCAVLALAGCHHHVATCDDDLHGTWQTPTMTWVLLDTGPTIEGYPLQPDPPVPRALDVTRELHMTGDVTRRAEASNCAARAPVHIETCHDDQLDVVIGDLQIGVAPCHSTVAPVTHLEHWHRLD